MFAHLPATTLVLDTSTPWEECLASATAYLRQHTELEEREGEQAHLQMRAIRLERRLAAVVLVNDREHLLLQYRGPRAPTSPGRWSLPGGSIEPGETAEMAAHREVREETGLHLDRPLEPLWQGLLPSVCQLGAYNEWFVFLTHTRAGQSEVTVGEGEVMVFLPLSEVLLLNVAPSTRYVLSLWFASRVECA
jgi:8-oxo-dGTP diphosphatase